MNGHRNPALERYLNDNDPISPTSLDSPWHGSAAVSSDLDARILGRAWMPIEPRASERSAALFNQLPDEVIEW